MCSRCGDRESTSNERYIFNLFFWLYWVIFFSSPPPFHVLYICTEHFPPHGWNHYGTFSQLDVDLIVLWKTLSVLLRMFVALPFCSNRCRECVQVSLLRLHFIISCKWIAGAGLHKNNLESRNNKHIFQQKQCSNRCFLFFSPKPYSAWVQSNCSISQQDTQFNMGTYGSGLTFFLLISA